MATPCKHVWKKCEIGFDARLPGDTDYVEITKGQTYCVNCYHIKGAGGQAEVAPKAPPIPVAELPTYIERKKPVNKPSEALPKVEKTPVRRPRTTTKPPEASPKKAAPKVAMFIEPEEDELEPF